MIGRHVWVNPMFAGHAPELRCPLHLPSRSTLDPEEGPFWISADRSPRPAARVPGASEGVHGQAFSG